MKKLYLSILTFLLFFFVLASFALAEQLRKTVTLSLPTSGVSRPGEPSVTVTGTVIDVTGTSIFYTNAASGATTLDMRNYADLDFFTVQVQTLEVLTGASPQNTDDATYTIYIKQSDIDTAAAWNDAELTPLRYKEPITSSASPYTTPAIVTDANFVQFYFGSDETTGTSAWAAMNINVKITKDSPSKSANLPIYVLGESYIPFDQTAGGTSKFSVHLTRPEGATWLRASPTKDNITFTTDGTTTPTANHTTLLDGTWVDLPCRFPHTEGWEFWFLPALNDSGWVNVTWYNRKP